MGDQKKSEHFWTALRNVANDLDVEFKCLQYNDLIPRIKFQSGKLQGVITKDNCITLRSYELGELLNLTIYTKKVELDFYIQVVKVFSEFSNHVDPLTSDHYLQLKKENVINTVKEYFPELKFSSFLSVVAFGDKDFLCHIHQDLGKETEWKILKRLLSLIYQNLT